MLLLDIKREPHLLQLSFSRIYVTPLKSTFSGSVCVINYHANPIIVLRAFLLWLWALLRCWWHSISAHNYSNECPLTFSYFHLILTSIWFVSGRVTRGPASDAAYLTDVIMFKQGQQANVRVTFNSLEEGYVAIAWIQLHVIVKDVRNSLATEQQVDQLLVNGNTKSQC